MYRIENKKEEFHVYISGTIEDKASLSLANEIKHAIRGGVRSLIIHLNSYGGSVKGAYDIVSAFKNTDAEVTTINEGFAISAAAVILAAGDKALAYDYSTALIHDPLMGNNSLEDTEGSIKDLLIAVKAGIMSIFSKRLKVNDDILSQMLTKETSFNAKEQKEIGLVDEIIERKNRPVIDNTLELVEIYNILEKHNKTENKMNEVINYLKLDEGASEEQILDSIKETMDKLTEVTNEVETLNENNTALNAELNTLKVENFILTNDLSAKADVINEAVTNHGIEVLNTILNFVDLSTPVSAPATTLDELVIEKPEVTDELKNELVELVNDANLELDNLVQTSEKTSEEKIKLANSIFAFNGDEEKRDELKNQNPELYAELVEIYANN